MYLFKFPKYLAFTCSGFLLLYYNCQKSTFERKTKNSFSFCLFVFRVSLPKEALLSMNTPMF